VSDTGTLVYVAGGIDELTDLVWADRAGRTEPLGEETQAAYPTVSPDGRRVAFSATVAGNRDIYVLEWARKARSRLTFDVALDVAPVWTPDGRRIIYSSARDGSGSNLYWQPADGTGTAERLTTNPNQQWPYAVTPDGQTVLYIEQGGRTSFDTYAVSLTGNRTPRPLLVTAADERRPTLSPDGKWMAYQSDESGSFEIFVRPFPEVESGRWQVSAGGGASPVWGPNGREIFFRSGQTIMRVEVSTSPVFEPGTPAPLVKTNLMPDAGGMQYGVAPDGKRFVLVQPHAAQGQRGQYHVVINWFEELKARVPREK
jgi:eukaryotic-like serine/threonine-protein kinase